jgi:transcriptional regulator with XRE-family HTH domain
MGSLSKCLSKNQIMGEDDIAEVSRLYEANLASGMSPRDAELAAAQSVLADLETVRSSIVQQIVSASPPATKRIVTPDGSMSVMAKSEVVDLANLKYASGALQPRDRSRAESTIGIRERAANLDPEQLLPTRVSDAGSPIVMQDGTILSGNGRVMSIAEVYRDPALKQQADAYRKSLGPEAEGMAQPVRVMRIAQPLEQAQAAKFADLSNRSRVAGLSATERALRDARGGADVLALYNGGDFTAGQNQNFLREFMARLVAPQELPNFSQNGALTKEGVDRMNAALLGAAYGDPELLSVMLESTDDNVRAFTNALRDAAGHFVRLKADIAAGVVPAQFDITPQIADTVKTVSGLRQRGVTPRAYLAQIDAFAVPSPITDALLKAFYNEDLTRALSQQKITEVLVNYATEASKKREGGLFEDTTGPTDVIRTARRPDTEDLFTGTPVRPSPGDGGVAARGRPDGRGREGPDRTEEAGLPQAFLDHVLAGNSLSREGRASLALDLGMGNDQMQALLDRAVADGWLRKDRRGIYRPGPKVAESRGDVQVKKTRSRKKAMQVIEDVHQAIDEISGVVRVDQVAIFDDVNELPSNLVSQAQRAMEAGGQVDAVADQTTGIVYLASYAVDMKGRLAHDGLHVMIQRGREAAMMKALEANPDLTTEELVVIGNEDNAVLTAAEMAILSEAADRIPGLFDRETYAKAYEGRANRDVALDEEAAVHLLEARVVGRDLGMEVNSILDRILQIIERIGNLVRGRGYVSAEDIVQLFLDGELVRRLDGVRLEGVAQESQSAPEEVETERARSMQDAVSQHSVRMEQAQRNGAMFALSDAETGRSMREDLDALGYYSGALRAAENLRQEKGTPEQMLAMLKKEGAKEAELQSVEIQQFLEGKTSVTKDEIIDFVEGNRVKLNQAVYGALQESDVEAAFGKAADDIEAMGVDRGKVNRFISQVMSYGRFENPTFVDEANRFLPEAVRPQAIQIAKDLFNLEKETRWSQYSLDPSNPTYRETVLNLPRNREVQRSRAQAEFERLTAEADAMQTRAEEAGSEAMARLEASAEFRDLLAKIEKAKATAAPGEQGGRLVSAIEGDFQSGHFSEPNIIGHMMTSMVRHEGKPTYLIDQIQSDWGQKLRDGGVRDEAKIAEWKVKLAEADAKLQAEAALVNAELDKLGVDPAFGAPGPMKTAYGDATMRVGRVLNEFRAAEKSGDSARIGELIGRAGDVEALLADRLGPLESEKFRIEGELRTYESESLGNPLVNTTDQWTTTTLRRAIRQAIEADAEYIAIPSGDTVLSYNPGDTDGMRGFYGATQVRDAAKYEQLKSEVEYARFTYDQTLDVQKDVQRRNAERTTPNSASELRSARQSVDIAAERHDALRRDLKVLEAASDRLIEGIVPKNLRKIIQKLDKKAPEPVRVDQLETPNKGMAGQGFTVFTLTDRVKEAVLSEGQAMFALSTVDADAGRLTKDVQAYEASLWAEGKTAEEVSEAIYDRYGFDVSPVDLAEGRVWWKLKEQWDFTPKSTGMDETLPPAAMTDWLTESAVAEEPEVVAPQAAPAELPPLRPEDDAEIRDLLSKGMTSVQIAESLTEQTGRYISLRQVAEVKASYDNKKRGKFKSSPWTKQAVAYLSKRTSEGAFASAIARELSDQLGMVVTAKAVNRKRDELRKSKAVEVPPVSLATKWTDERLAVLTEGAINGLKQNEIKELLYQRLGTRIGSSKAVGAKLRDLGSTRKRVDGGRVRVAEPRLRVLRGTWHIVDGKKINDTGIPEPNAARAQSALQEYQAQAAVPANKIDLPDQGPMFALGPVNPKRWLDAYNKREETQDRGTDIEGSVRDGGRAGEGSPDLDRTGNADERGRIGGASLFDVRGTVGKLAVLRPSHGGLGRRLYFYYSQKSQALPSAEATDPVTAKFMRGTSHWWVKTQVAEDQDGTWRLVGINIRKNRRLRRELATDTIRSIENSVGTTLKPGHELNWFEYLVWKRERPEEIAGYVKIGRTVYSPDKAERVRLELERLLEVTKNGRERAAIRKDRDALYKALQKKLKDGGVDNGPMFAISDVPDDIEAWFAQQETGNAARRNDGEGSGTGRLGLGTEGPVVAGGQPGARGNSKQALDRQGSGSAAESARGNAGMGSVVRTSSISRAGYDFRNVDGVAQRNGLPTRVYYAYQGSKSPQVEAPNGPTARKKLDKTAWAGRVELQQRGPDAWEVTSLKVHPNEQRRGLASDMYDAIEQDLGVSMRPSGILTLDGYSFWQRRNPEALKYHRRFLNGWWSPKALIGYKLTNDERAQNAGSIEDLQGALDINQRLNSILGSVPKEAFEEQAMTAMFALSRRKANLSPEVQQQRAQAWRFPDGQTEAGRRVGEARWYHGANRVDRIVKSGKFDPKRATSGPMAFFTTKPEMASNYAVGKQDTSLYDDGDIQKYFTVSAKALETGGRTPISAERSWYYLKPEQKKLILERMGRVGYENIETGDGPWTLHPEGVEASLNNNHLDWLLKNEARGNPLAALRMMWLEGGDLVGREYELAEIYKLAGYPHQISDDTAPWYEAPGVIPVFLRMITPLDTHNFDELRTKVIPALEQKFAKDRSRTKQFGADMWDKSTRWTPKEWVAQLKEDVTGERNAYTWTSIPDRVSDALRELGYDGILDRGNKSGMGDDHLVAIPFKPQQVRSVNAAFDPDMADDPNIMFAIGKDTEADAGMAGIPTDTTGVASASVPPTQSLTGISRIVAMLGDAIGLPIRVGRLPRYPGARVSVSYADSAVGRIRDVDNIHQASEVSAMHLERILGPEFNDLRTKHSVELLAIAREYGGDDLSVGFHHFFDLYMTSYLGRYAYNKAPKFYDAFENLLGKNAPQMLADIQEVQEAYANYSKADPSERLKTDIIRPEAEEPYRADLARRAQAEIAKLDPNGRGTRMGFVWQVTRKLMSDFYRNFVGRNFAGQQLQAMALEFRENNTAMEGVPYYQRIQSRLTELNISPEELADQTNLDSVLIEGILSGAKKPSKTIADKIGLVIGRSRQWIATGRDRISLPAGQDLWAVMKSSGNVRSWVENVIQYGFQSRVPAKDGSLARLGPGYVEVMAAVMNAKDNNFEYNDEMLQDFDAFLIARRAAENLYPRFRQGLLPHQPVRESEAAVRKVMADMLKKHPHFAEAAQKWDEFNQSWLAYANEWGLLTQEQYDSWSQDRAYAPFSRDMSDTEIQEMRSAMAGKPSASKPLSYRLMGSDRNILSPTAVMMARIQSLIQRSYQQGFAETLENLHDLAGPGIGMVLEKVPATDVRVQQMNAMEAVRKVVKAAGLEMDDVQVLLDAMADVAGDPTTLQINSITQRPISPKAGETLIPYRKNGELHFIAIYGTKAEPHLARDIFSTFAMAGSESMPVWLEIMRNFAQFRRATITTWPGFIWRNLVQDPIVHWGLFRWMKYPGQSHVKGFKSWWNEDEFYQAYTSRIAGSGIMGGAMTAEARRGLEQQDVRQLVGATTGVFENLRVFWDKVGQVSEASETFGRLGLFRMAAERAMAQGMTPLQAIQEAGTAATDVMNYNEFGHMMAAIRSISPFTGAGIVGTDKTARTVTAYSQRGYAIKNYIDAWQKYGDRVTAWESLSDNEQDAIKTAAATTFKGLFVFGLIEVVLWAMFHDDDLWKDQPDDVHDTHWVIPIAGAVHLVNKEWDTPSFLDDQAIRIPKPFELTVPANVVRMSLDAMARDQGGKVAAERISSSIRQSFTPPLSLPFLEEYFAISSNRDPMSDRALISESLLKKSPEEQFTAYTSYLGKTVGDALMVSPVGVDFAVKSVLGPWGRDLLTLTDRLDPNKPAMSLSQTPIGVSRFVTSMGKGSRTMDNYYEMMNPPLQLNTNHIVRLMGGHVQAFNPAKANYADAVDKGRLDVAREELGKMSNDERIYAMLSEHWKSSNEVAELSEVAHKRLHPIVRFEALREVLMDSSRDVVSNKLIRDKTSLEKKAGTQYYPVEMTDVQRRDVLRILKHMQIIEASNAMSLIGRPGYTADGPYPIEPMWKELKAAAPKAYEEVRRRVEKAKILPFEAVQSVWPDVKRVMSDPSLPDKMTKTESPVVRHILAGPMSRAAGEGRKITSATSRPDGMMRLGGPVDPNPTLEVADDLAADLANPVAGQPYLPEPDEDIEGGWMDAVGQEREMIGGSYPSN